MKDCRNCKNENTVKCFVCLTAQGQAPSHWEPKEVNMEIKVVRKPVDKKAEVKKLINRAYYAGGSGNTAEWDGIEKETEKIMGILSSEAQEEIESIEIQVPFEQIQTYNVLNIPKVLKVKLTPDQLKEINKAVESK